jgi:hypothetical protein
MATYTLTKIPDGDVNFGNQNGEYVDLQPGTSDYATSGYAIIDGVSAVDNPTLLSSVNCDMYNVVAAIPVANEGGYVLQFQSATKKVKVMQQSAATGPLTEVPANTNLAAQTFRLLLIGT